MQKMEKFAIDCLDQFSHREPSSEGWIVGSSLMENLGADALTLGAISPCSFEPTWARSSMEVEFLKQYVEEDFFSLDPFVADLAQDMQPVICVPENELSVTAREGGGGEFRSRLNDFGYRFLYGVKSGGRREGEIKILTFCSKRPPGEFDAHEVLKIRLAATIMMAHTGPPQEYADDIITQSRFKPLTPRENEVLRLYALGYRNGRITDELNISDVMVRKHATSARKKLGAKTRDQTLMLALKHRLIEV